MVDSESTVSAQCDWIIYDAVNCPPLIPQLLGTEGFEWVPFDASFGTVEVKRTLTQGVLGKAIEQISETKKMKREDTNIFSINPFRQYPPIVFNVRSDSVLKKTNDAFSGIYAYQADSGIVEQGSGHILSILMDTGLPFDLLPDFVAVHGRTYVRKVAIGMNEDGETGWGITHFPQDANGYAVVDFGAKTAGVFYFDMLSQFANMDVSARYQTTLLREFLTEELRGKRAEAHVYPGMELKGPKIG